ncbi:MAG: hypothetical protein CL908_22675 [Deltaproteobacteria bacterium]|nr:hypothetical protein [Deltaproteobacteria bacterium]
MPKRSECYSQAWIPHGTSYGVLVGELELLGRGFVWRAAIVLVARALTMRFTPIRSSRAVHPGRAVLAHTAPLPILSLMDEDIMVGTQRLGAAVTIATFLRRHRFDLVCVLVLFVFCGSLRAIYQSESVTDTPIRADAGSYVFAAANLRFHGAYSTDRPGPEAPVSRTDIAPGYPLFLTPFVEQTDTGWTIRINHVRRVQILMDCLVAVLTFALARLALPLGWALLAGGLTCMSPHLIVFSDYLLTESLFTFLMMAGVWVLALAWRRPGAWLLFAGIFLLGLAAEVRLVALAVPLFFAPLFLFRGEAGGWTDRRVRVLAVTALVAGVLAVQMLHATFERVAVTNSGALREVPVEHSQVKSPLEYLDVTIRPPKWYVEGKSHVFPLNRDPEWRDRTTSGFAAEPHAYLRWNLYGRLIAIWNFDNVFAGDVYIYPMVRKGFEENVVLGAIHSLMRFLHWPLFGLALAGVVLLVAQSRRRGGPRMEMWGLWPSALGFVYFLAVLTVLAWLPRYSIPARPFSYIMAAACLAALVKWLRKDRKLTPQHGPSEARG